LIRDPGHRLVLRTTLLVLAAALVVGALTQGLVGRLVRRWEGERQRQALEALLDVVGPTAAAACFAQDEALAQQVVDGLAGTPMVHGAQLRAGDQLLAAARRPGTLHGPPQDRVRAILSPFAQETRIGELVLTPDPWEAARREAAAVALSRLTLAGLGLAMGLVVAGTVHRSIVQPITRVSAGLHGLDADSGGRLRVPRGHTGDEIGRLVADVNALVQRLVAALWKEQELHQQLAAGKRLAEPDPGRGGTGIFVLRGDGILEAWTPALPALLGLDGAPPAPGSRFAPLFGEAAAQVEACLARCRGGTSPATATLRLGDPGGTGHRWLQLALERIGPDWCQGLLDDVSWHRHEPSPAGRPELQDAVTGALNRLGAEYALAARFEAGARGMAILRVDLEPADKPTEGPGPEPAEPLLREAAARMTAALRRMDLVARLEGGQFLVILDHLEEAEPALATARKLGDALTAAQRPRGATAPRIGAAIGLTLRRAGEAPGGAALLARAEQALAEAKAAGGNCCRLI